MSPEQVEATRESDPVFYRYARYGSLRALNALFNEVPEAKDRFLAGLSFRISSDELTDRTRDLLFSAGNEFRRFMQYGRGEPVGFGSSLSPDDPFDIAYNRLDTDSFTPNQRWGIYSFSSTGYFCISKGASDTQIVDLKDKSSKLARVLCERENMIIDTKERKAASVVFQSHVPELIAERRDEEDLLNPSEPVNEHSDFSGLDDIVRLKVEIPKAEQSRALVTNTYIASFEKAVADATGLGVVSDSWVSLEGEALHDQQVALRELLEKFATQFNYNWGKSSSILEFRHRKWWKNRRNQIPDEWVAAWSENTRKKGVLSLDDLAQISCLDYYQAEESLTPDNVLGADGIYFEILKILDGNGNFHWLRLYSSLSPQLRGLLMGQGGVTGNGGINGHMLTAQQWKLAQTMFDRIASDRSDAIFRLEQVPNDAAVIYRFREIDADSGEEDRTWQVTLPKYVAPPAKTDAVKSQSK